MLVKVLYLEGCPAAPSAVDLIRDVAAELGISVSLEQVLVENAEQAAALRFLGSPTVQLDGQDIEPEARDSLDFGLT